MMVRARLCPALVCCALAALCGSATATAVAANPGPYVSLGDSYSAAPLVPTQHGDPLACYRSTNNYPSLVATGLGAANFTDVSCSGAETKDMTGAQSVQLGSNPPQFNALSKTAKLVTVGIGGNDVGLVGIAIKCLEIGALAPTGTACRTYYAPGGNDTVVAKINMVAARIAAVLQGIHERSPDARVAIVGYPDVAPRDGTGCYPLVPVSPDDLSYLNGLIVQINAMIKTQAAANDAEFVDTYADSVGHDVCTAPGTRWFEGLIPTMLAYPLHPNALGEASMARSVLRVLGAPRPAPVLTALKAVHRKIKRGRAAAVRFTINRAATVAFTLRRAKRGRRVGGSCRVPTKSNAGKPGCVRYSRVLRTLTVDALRGENISKLKSKSLRRAARYRITATASSGAGGLVSDPQITYVRVKRPR
jgi:lysophospholipase L1-like esterase